MQEAKLAQIISWAVFILVIIIPIAITGWLEPEWLMRIIAIGMSSIIFSLYLLWGGDFFSLRLARKNIKNLVLLLVYLVFWGVYLYFFGAGTPS